MPSDGVGFFEERFQVRERFQKTFGDKTVPVYATALFYCFGGLTTLSFAIQVLSGALLLMYYVPDADVAYQSVHYISHTVPYGWFIRGAHFFGANAMAAMVFSHTLRVFYTGSYRRPRELMWVSGVLALLLTLAMAFTGYLLKWDQIAYWGLTAVTGLMAYIPVMGPPLRLMLLGGDGVTGATLSRFFALHVAIVPGVLITTLVAHFWMIRKQGISRPL
jgi:quinol-cytochrome oxidoreductase complex cytochrome b subunit